MPRQKSRRQKRSKRKVSNSEKSNLRMLTMALAILAIFLLVLGAFTKSGTVMWLVFGILGVSLLAAACIAPYIKRAKKGI